MSEKAHICIPVFSPSRENGLFAMFACRTCRTPMMAIKTTKNDRDFGDK